MLDRLEYADRMLARLLVPDLIDYLRGHEDLAAVALEKIVSVLIGAQPFTSEELAELAEARATAATDPVVAAYYLLLLFAREGDRAVDRLREKMSTFDGQEQAALCCTLLPRLFGGRFNRTVAPPLPLSAERLEQLLIIAFEGVRPADDIVRANGKAYSPGLRDEAQDARHTIFDRLLKTPGEATQAAIRRMAEIPDFPIEPKHLRIHAERHAEVNSELFAWLPSDVVVFERNFDRAPRTTEDLQLIARRRLEAIEHDLLHGKFAQGDTLQGLGMRPGNLADRAQDMTKAVVVGAGGIDAERLHGAGTAAGLADIEGADRLCRRRACRPGVAAEIEDRAVERRIGFGRGERLEREEDIGAVVAVLRVDRLKRIACAAALFSPGPISAIGHARRQILTGAGGQRLHRGKRIRDTGIERRDQFAIDVHYREEVVLIDG